MIHQMIQAIGHIFVNHAPIMANYVHNASQMVFSPTGSATGTSQIHPQAQADEGVIDAQPISTVASTQFSPVYTNSTPMATYA